MKKFWRICVIYFMSLVLLAGCVKKFDAADYIEAILDLSIKGDREKAEKYLDNPDDIEEIEKEIFEAYEKGIDLQMAELPEAARQEWKDLILDIVKESKYTVGEAEKKEDSYEMDVTVEPIAGVFENLETPIREGFRSYLESSKADILNGTITEEEADNAVYKIVFDAIRENMGNIYYTDPQTFPVSVKAGDEFSFTGIEDVGAAVIDYTALDVLDVWKIWQEEAGFDAAGFVEASLDMITKGDTESIKKYLTDPEEISQDQYMQFWDEIFGGMGSEMGVSEEAVSEWKDMFQAILSETRYTVGEAQQVGDDYIVEVTFEPIAGIFDGMGAQIEEEMLAYAEANAGAIADGTITEADIYSEAFKIMARGAKANMDKIYYADPQTATIHVEKGAEGYDVSEADAQNLFEWMVDTSGIENIL